MRDKEREDRDVALFASIDGALQCPVCGEWREMHLGRRAGDGTRLEIVPARCRCEREREGAANKSLTPGQAQARKSRQKGAKLLSVAGLQNLCVHNDHDYFAEWAADTSCELRDAVRAYIKDAEYRINQGIGLLMLGPPRTGKTYAACAIVQSLTAQGYVIAHARADDYLASIRATYGDGVSYTDDQLLSALERADMIVLDDLGAGKPLTRWGLSMLYTIVDNAYRTMTPIIITSNCAEGQISSLLEDENGVDRISPRLLERVQTIYVEERCFTDSVRAATEILVAGRNRQLLDGAGSFTD